MTKPRRFKGSFIRAALAGIVTFGFAVTAGSTTAATPTFSKDVAPILFKRCVSCHQPGQIGSSVVLLTYDGARPWARAIKQKILTHEMPPWPADPSSSVKFRNDARLSRKEIETLAAWVDTGALRGSDGDLPPLPKFPGGWQHPKGAPPDAIISMSGGFEVPAQGEIPYVRYLAQVPFSDDKWIAALEVRPGNRAVVHHMAITEVQLQGGMKPADLDALGTLARQMGMGNSLPGSRPAVTAPGDPTLVDMLGVYTPGTSLEIYGDDSAKLIRGGTNFYINFNIHYQATGKPEKDRSMLALWFRDGPPRHQLLRVPGAAKTMIANGQELLSDAALGRKAEGTGAAIPPIPPYADNYELTGITAYTDPITIFELQPHAHVRCKDFKYVIVYPNGREQTVLTVPKYNFQWQLAYELETPLQLPAGSKLAVTAHYDNSRNNQYNPAPDREVYFRDAGNQSWDEMFTPFIQYSSDKDLQNDKGTRQPARAQNGVPIVEVDGCLEGKDEAWTLTHAVEPIVAEAQSASTISLRSAAARPFGNEAYRLVGTSFFHPSIHIGQKVAVKGALIQGSRIINITSLQAVGLTCAN